MYPLYRRGDRPAMRRMAGGCRHALIFVEPVPSGHGMRHMDLSVRSATPVQKDCANQEVWRQTGDLPCPHGGTSFLPALRQNFQFGFRTLPSRLETLVGTDNITVGKIPQTGRARGAGFRPCAKFVWTRILGKNCLSSLLVMCQLQTGLEWSDWRRRSDPRARGAPDSLEELARRLL